MKTLNKHLFFGFSICILLFSGCKTAVTLEKKEIPTLPNSYKNDTDSNSVANLKIEEYFTDKQLVSLIDIAIYNNQDVLIALQKINTSQQESRISKSALMPTVSGNITTAQRRYGLYTMDGAGNITTEITPGKIVPIHLRDYYIGLQTNWEVDVWGKLKNNKKAALYRFLNSIEGKNLVITNLVAEVATTYYELLAADNELEIVRETIVLQQNALELVKMQKEVGNTNLLAVKQFEAQLLNTKSREHEITQNIVELENTLNFLLGRLPQPIERDKAKFNPIGYTKIKSGIPSELLQNRPDIKQAEYELLTAKCDVNAAKAQFYPSLTITGGFGYQAFSTAFLFTTPQSIAYSLVGGLVTPLINRTAIKANYSINKSKQSEALLNYQKIILGSFVEVSNELTKIENLEKINNLKSEEVVALTQSIEISNDLFKSGRSNYLEVLSAQKNALDAKLGLIDSRNNQHKNYITIYKALGGGWR